MVNMNHYGDSMTNRYIPDSSSRETARTWFVWPLGAWLAGVASAVVLFALAVVGHAGSWIVALLVPFALVGVALAAIDIRWRVIPNRIVVPAVIAAVALAAITGFADGDPGRVLGALAGAVALFIVYLVPALIAPASMGFGDVKLAALVGAVLGSLGLQAWIAGALAGFIIGALVGLVALATGRATLRSRVPFAPAMLAGSWVAIVLAPFIQ